MLGDEVGKSVKNQERHEIGVVTVEVEIEWEKDLL